MCHHTPCHDNGPTYKTKQRLSQGLPLSWCLHSNRTVTNKNKDTKKGGVGEGGERKGEKNTQENIYKLNQRKHQGDYHDQVGLIPETQGWLVYNKHL